MQFSRLLFFIASVTLLASCAGKQKKEPEPVKAQCDQFEPYTETLIGQLDCAGSDEDKDGVDDAVDACPQRKETANEQQDGDGCPDPDADRDGVDDELDLCPNAFGPYPEGCPVVDTDNDGIPDHLDACLKQPEDLDGDADSDGCPEGPQTTQQAPEGARFWKDVKLGCQRGKARLTGTGGEKLLELQQFVRANTGRMMAIKIKGFAGEQESNGANLQSLARERSMLVEKGFRSIGLAQHRIQASAHPLPEAERRRAGYVVIGIWVDPVLAMSLGLDAEEASEQNADDSPQGGQRVIRKRSDMRGDETSMVSEGEPKETNESPSETHEAHKPDAISDDEWDQQLLDD